MEPIRPNQNFNKLPQDDSKDMSKGNPFLSVDSKYIDSKYLSGFLTVDTGSDPITFSAKPTFISRFENREPDFKLLVPIDQVYLGSLKALLLRDYMENDQREIVDSVVTFLCKHFSVLSSDRTSSSFRLNYEKEGWILKDLNNRCNKSFTQSEISIIEKVLEKAFFYLSIQCCSEPEGNGFSYSLFFYLDKSEESKEQVSISRFSNQEVQVGLLDPLDRKCFENVKELVGQFDMTDDQLEIVPHVVTFLCKHFSDLPLDCVSSSFQLNYEEEGWILKDSNNRCAKLFKQNDISIIENILDYTFDNLHIQCSSKAEENRISYTLFFILDKREENKDAYFIDLSSEREKVGKAAKTYNQSLRRKPQPSLLKNTSNLRIEKNTDLLDRYEYENRLLQYEWEKRIHMLERENFHINENSSFHASSASLVSRFIGIVPNLDEISPFSRDFLDLLSNLVDIPNWKLKEDVLNFLIVQFPEKGDHFSFYALQKNRTLILSSSKEEIQCSDKISQKSEVSDIPKLELEVEEYQQFENLLLQLTYNLGIQVTAVMNENMTTYTVHFKYS